MNAIHNFLKYILELLDADNLGLIISTGTLAEHNYVNIAGLAPNFLSASHPLSGSRSLSHHIIFLCPALYPLRDQFSTLFATNTESMLN
jgi:hypothetical protein